jgi:hypothetical protein
MPEDTLDRLLHLTGRFYQTVLYRLSETPGRTGGAGAGGLQRLTVPTWFGQRLVIPDIRPATRPTMTTFSLEGDRLKLETRADVVATGASTVTEWFSRVR